MGVGWSTSLSSAAALSLQFASPPRPQVSLGQGSWVQQVRLEGPVGLPSPGWPRGPWAGGRVSSTDLEEVPGVTSTRCPAVSSRVYQHLLLPARHTSDLAEGHRGAQTPTGCPGRQPRWPALTSALCKSRRVGVHLPTYPACHELPIGELGPQDQMWPLPSGGSPILRVGQRRLSRLCGQLISVLISLALGRGWALDGPPGSPGLRLLWATLSGLAVSRSRGSCPHSILPPAVSPSTMPLCCPQVAWSLLNLQEAGGISPDSQPLIYVLLWGVFSLKTGWI